AAVAFFADFPIDPQLEVLVVIDSLQAVALAIVVEEAVFHGPVRQKLLIGFLLFLVQFFGLQLGALGQFHQTLPRSAVLAVEKESEAVGSDIIFGAGLVAVLGFRLTLVFVFGGILGLVFGC